MRDTKNSGFNMTADERHRGLVTMMLSIGRTQAEAEAMADNLCGRQGDVKATVEAEPDDDEADGYDGTGDDVETGSLPCFVPGQGDRPAPRGLVLKFDPAKRRQPIGWSHAEVLR